MKLVILLSAVFVVLGAWAANLPPDEENQSDIRHRSQRQSDKNVEAMKLYLLGQACNYGASYRKYFKVIFLKMTKVSNHQLCKLKMLRERERERESKRKRERDIEDGRIFISNHLQCKT